MLLPKLDKQLDVHNALLALLDQALTNLTAGGAGPGAVDLVYGGDKTKWIAAAHTLKARLYMHLAELDASNYAKALTETNAGISAAAGDFTTYHSGSTGENNHWNQFRLGRGHRHQRRRVFRRLDEVPHRSAADRVFRARI